MEQMAPCVLTEADRVGCYRNRAIGEPGLACRHCVGQAGSGRYFPATESSLSQTTTSQTILSHVLNCLRCPIEIRENIEIMKRGRTKSERKKVHKPKHGGRKTFFHRLWCRIHGVPIQNEEEADGGDDWKPKKQNTVSGSPSNRSNTKTNEFHDFSPIRKARRRSTRLFGDGGDGADETNFERKATASRNTGTDTNRAAHLQGYARINDKRSDRKDDGNDDDKPGDNMNALIKAAAIWLTEKDQAGGSGGEGNNSSGGSPSLRIRASTSKTAKAGAPSKSPRKRRKIGA